MFFLSVSSADYFFVKCDFWTSDATRRPKKTNLVVLPNIPWSQKILDTNLGHPLTLSKIIPNPKSTRPYLLRHIHDKRLPKSDNDYITKFDARTVV